ncbi:MAG: serine/threonine-protein kinase [Acidobacteriia bacterium]|nr:serine/threonine-protein kinase [Terriglobia bacterium]
MTPERWHRIEELFHAALARGPESRRAFLDEACRADAELRREVESLLAQEEQADALPETHRLEATATILLGKQLGPYRILSPLGVGGMGEVYRAHDSKLSRDVAIKTLPREFARDPEKLARFRREARTLASLNHPNIAAIYGLEEFDGAMYLVLELVEGETLQGPLPIGKALDYALQISEALGAAHEKGIVHRDLKPANVKVTPQGRVKVLDFGLAKAVWGSDHAQNFSQLSTVVGPETVVGQVVGTPPYMSPEQARGGDIDKRTDIWAFGCVLYELLTGKRAFRGKTLGDTIQAILDREPDWTALPAKTPAKIRSLLRRCLDKDATGRLQDIGAARVEIARVQRGLSRWQIASIAAAAAAIAAVGVAVYFRGPAGPAERSEWVQLTNFPDAVGQPALSPDGRMLAFIRSSDTFVAPGQVYVKTLPDGEPVQLTHDDLNKHSPVFSPDGSRIAYAAAGDTWVVPVVSGQPRPWLTNATGLVWIDKQRLLFSEVKKDIHMGIVTAEENRAGQRDVYLPEGNRGMAHRSYPSPDGKSVLVVEMDRGPWQPCRVVPLDGSSFGHRVGPPGAACTFAAWSPDSKWMYLTSSKGGTFHTWRQRYPDGPVEQITSGLTEEEGIAMAADGRSFVTAVAQKQSTVWVHDKNGERQVSLEGYSYDPRFTPDGKKLLYRILKGAVPTYDPGELRLLELDSGHNEPLLPGLLVSGLPGRGFDISPDGQRVVAAATDGQGKPRLWLAALDRQSPPHQIPNVEGGQPHFGDNGEIFFTKKEGTTTQAYRVHEDGTGLRTLGDQITAVIGVSSDKRWAVGAKAEGRHMMLLPTDGSPGTLIGPINDTKFVWSPNGRLLFVSVPTGPLASGIVGRTYVISLPLGQVFPPIPAGGFQTMDDLSKLPGVRVIEAYGAAPGPTSDVYAFARSSVQRNLYRIPIP